MRRIVFLGLGLILILAGGCRLWPGTSDEERETVQRETVPEIVFEEPDLPKPQDAVVEEEESGETAPCTPASKDSRPLVAIIIDDMGYHRKVGERLLALDMDLTFSFLPHAPFTKEQESRAWEKGRDVLIHMPMEARDPAWDPGPGALFVKDSAEELVRKVRENLEAVPHATGCNNHMGSRFTEDAQAMRIVLAELKRQGLYFIDSYTTAASTGLVEAKKMHMLSARRHVFLDNVHDPGKICHQLEELVRLARKKGWAIGIGHPNQATLDALTHCRERLLQEVQVVGVHKLVREQP